MIGWYCLAGFLAGMILGIVADYFYPEKRE